MDGDFKKKAVMKFLRDVSNESSTRFTRRKNSRNGFETLGLLAENCPFDR